MAETKQKEAILTLVPVGPQKETTIVDLPTTAKPLKVINHRRIPHLVILVGGTEEEETPEVKTLTIYMLKENQPFPYSPDAIYLGSLDLNNNGPLLHFIAV